MTNKMTRRKQQLKMRPSYDELTIYEPRLLELWEQVQQVADGEGFCANEHWYQKVKPEVSRLVGWETECRHPMICGCYAYDIVYEQLYALLPNCNHHGHLCR